MNLLFLRPDSIELFMNKSYIFLLRLSIYNEFIAL